jgi:hypothetical protein
LKRETFGGFRHPTELARDHSGDKNPSYLDFYKKGHSGDTDRLMNLQNLNGLVTEEEFE